MTLESLHQPVAVIETGASGRDDAAERMGWSCRWCRGWERWAAVGAAVMGKRAGPLMARRG